MSVLIMETLRHIRNMPSGFRGEYSLDYVDAYPEYPVYVTLIYLYIVFYMPENVMKKRAPINPRKTLFLWNFTIAVISFIGSYTLVPEMWLRLKYRGFYNTACVTNYDVTVDGEVGFYVALFMCLKIPELLDTFFLVLQKKRVSFLQWYHHLVTALFVWSVSYSQIPSGLWFATMNYCVHSVMYLYYAFNGLGFRKYVRPFAPLITLMQVAQMFFGTGIVIYTTTKYFSPEGCDIDVPSLRIGLMMYGSYCILFCVLFKQLYLDKKDSKSSFVRNIRAEEADVPVAVPSIKR